jgi:hypothetical protein
VEDQAAPYICPYLADVGMSPLFVIPTEAAAVRRLRSGDLHFHLATRDRVEEPGFSPVSKW